MMACSTSIGPGATNLVTSAALAHVNRLPVLFLPGDIFISRDPDPVLQQVESSGMGQYRPMIVSARCRATSIGLFTLAIANGPSASGAHLTDPALCGPVTLALPQDVQADAFDYPVEFFETPVVEFRAMPPNESDLAGATRAVIAAKRPVMIAGGGVLYGAASGSLREFSERHGVPVCETQAGKSSLPWDHPLQLGSVGVTGSTAANALTSEADLILAVGTRLQDFTSGSNSLFPKARIVSLNVNPFDANKSRGIALQADARLGLEALSKSLPRWQKGNGPSAPRRRPTPGAPLWTRSRNAASLPPVSFPMMARSWRRAALEPAIHLPTSPFAGTLPAELHKLWRTSTPGGYHMEYGYSCMGYEIAGGLGVKMA